MELFFDENKQEQRMDFRPDLPLIFWGTMFALFAAGSK
jgi:hypothetical protein